MMKVELSLLAFLAGAVYGQSSSCTNTLAASYAAPSVASGYIARLVTKNLTSPRGIKFDSKGALLVVEEGVGVSALNFNNDNNCTNLRSRKLVINEPSLNHGIELSPDGSTLYASSGETLWSWTYNPDSQMNTSAPKALVTGMAGSDHTSRTLLLSQKAPGMMVINRGSNSNLDLEAEDISTGHSQVKAFNVTNNTQAYDFNTQGILLGWGLRNDVGLAEEPLTGRIYSVENSADQVNRSGQDIHQNNPAEKLNFLGYLNGTQTSNQGRNFGYPYCFAAWRLQEIPSFNGTVGQQFAIGDLNSTVNDTTCTNTTHQPPRLVFQAHTAPLDIKFNPQGTAAWITFHGSWNRASPIGYDLRVVPFVNGQPVANSTSTDAAVPIMSNQNLTACPGGCFRPVGMAFNTQGQLFMSSDSTGEIYAISRSDGSRVSSAGSNSTGSIPSGTATGSAPGATRSKSSASEYLGSSPTYVLLAPLILMVASLR